MTSSTTVTKWRVERLESRRTHPFYGHWCQDIYTGLSEYDTEAEAFERFMNRQGPYAYQEWRVVEMCTTFTTLYSGT